MPLVMCQTTKLLIFCAEHKLTFEQAWDQLVHNVLKSLVRPFKRSGGGITLLSFPFSLTNSIVVNLEKLFLTGYTVPYIQQRFCFVDLHITNRAELAGLQIPHNTHFAN